MARLLVRNVLTNNDVVSRNFFSELGGKAFFKVAGNNSEQIYESTQKHSCVDYIYST